MDDATAWETLATERLALADVLDTLTPEQWTTPSLCGEWTVKDVAAHLLVGPTASVPEFLVAMVRARLDFDRANVRMTAKRAAASTSEITAQLRANAGSRFTPPGFDWHAPLTDTLLHRLDCLVPLGIPAGRSDDGWREALGFLVSPKARRGFTGGTVPALTYVATDLGWTSGTGPRVEGPAEALGLALSRRPARVEELSGAGAGPLSDWATRRTA